MAAKISQAHYANAHRGTEDVFMAGDLVMLSTFNQCKEYKKKGEFRVVKLFPHWDGLYQVTKAFPKFSSYILDTQHMSNKCSACHASKLKCHTLNNDHLFPLRAHPHGRWTRRTSNVKVTGGNISSDGLGMGQNTTNGLPPNT